MAALDGEDELTYLRIMWNELKGEKSPFRVDDSSKATKSMFITIARSLYDKLFRATPTAKSAEKRIDRSNWPQGESGGWRRNHSLGEWRTVSSGFTWSQLKQRHVLYDDQFLSEKKQSQEGLKPFEHSARNIHFLEAVSE